MFEKDGLGLQELQERGRASTDIGLVRRAHRRNEFAALTQLSKALASIWTPLKSVTERPGCGNFCAIENPASDG